ncbi:ROK family protein, partial [Clavibacter michiganensis]|uniref:ROK family protein n=1 Tax=Clavibacter michiganensis TaxID=28447 RepID=UPI00292D489A
AGVARGSRRGAAAEHWGGAGRGHDPVMGMIVSTGVGGGRVLSGRTAARSTGNVGHIGHGRVGGS